MSKGAPRNFNIDFSLDPGVQIKWQCASKNANVTQSLSVKTKIPSLAGPPFPCPPLMILKSKLFRGLWAYELKFRSKKDNVMIFSQWKLRCCFFQIWDPGGIQDASQSSIFWYEILKFFKIKKKKKYKILKLK